MTFKMNFKKKDDDIWTKIRVSLKEMPLKMSAILFGHNQVYFNITFQSWSSLHLKTQTLLELDRCQCLQIRRSKPSLTKSWFHRTICVQNWFSLAIICKCECFLNSAVREYTWRCTWHYRYALCIITHLCHAFQQYAIYDAFINSQNDAIPARLGNDKHITVPHSLVSRLRAWALRDTLARAKQALSLSLNNGDVTWHCRACRLVGPPRGVVTIWKRGRASAWHMARKITLIVAINWVEYGLEKIRSPHAGGPLGSRVCTTSHH